MTTATDIARSSLEGYVSNGPAHWPCSAYFTLASLDTNGETDGGGADICRGCVRAVAYEATLAMDDHPIDFGSVPKVGEPFSAIVTCGPAPAYDITGNDDTYAAGYGGEHTWCAQCGAEIE